MLSDAEFFHRRHLPHLYLPNAVYFITFRLARSLPNHAIEGLQEKSRLRRREPFGYVDYDKALDKCKANVKWLLDDRIAPLIAEAIKHRDGGDYDLAACCIMPNHVHLVIGVGNHDLFEPVRQIDNLSDMPLSKNLKHDVLGTVRQVGNLSNKSVSEIMRSLKRYTAREANKVLKRSGAFWQDESYDHVIRNEAELERIVRYVAYNPVKAKLIQNWRDWKWTYTVFDID
jgi:REP element-mobilizing transposase RayT